MANISENRASRSRSVTISGTARNIDGIADYAKENDFTPTKRRCHARFHPEKANEERVRRYARVVLHETVVHSLWDDCRGDG